MSEHTLPPDHDSWPSDPYLLLGVAPGVSARDLRKAYLRLIRSYKPEHSPEQFQKIRKAYESALAKAQSFDSIRDEFEAAFDFEPTVEPALEPEPQAPLSRPREPAVDPWELALAGQHEPAYLALIERQSRGNADEETFLQLYWLATLVPGLDATRQPIDWLIRGLAERGARSGRLRELFRRELAADAAVAVDDRLADFFRRSGPSALTLDVAIPRWKAARSANRWSLILADVQALRGWLPRVDPDAWARLLLAASANLAWAGNPEAEQSVAFCREVERHALRQDNYAEEFYQIEYAQMVKAGLDRLGGRTGGTSALYVLLSSSWDEQGPLFRSRLRTYVDQIAGDPRVSLEGVDRIQATAPAVLGRLSSLLGGLDHDDSRQWTSRSRSHAGLAPVIDQFLADRTWTDYRSLRLPLLRFCLREAIAPRWVARTLEEHPEFVLTGKSPLARSILDDWPLRHVYRAAELSRAEPAPGQFGPL